MTDRLDAIFEIQRQLQEEMARRGRLAATELHHLDVAAATSQTKEWVLAIVAELGEILEWTNWKPWKTRAEDLPNIEELRIELIDVLHFILNLFIDVGCGIDVALARVLSSSAVQPQRYVGVDLNQIRHKPGNHWVTVLDEFDVTARWQELGLFTVVACFEVMEHMAVEDGRRLLWAIHGLLEPGGRAYLSTPVFNGRAAANHIHEYKIVELKEEIEAAGFVVEDRWGAFASAPDLMKALPQELRGVLAAIGRRVGYDLAACAFAPLYPDVSRNNVWVLRRAIDGFKSGMLQVCHSAVDDQQNLF